jgi:type II secretory pathway component GspD/PulD (secretin)
MMNGIRSVRPNRFIAVALMVALGVTCGGFVASARGAGLEGNPVTIELKGADVRDVLKILAELGGVNIVSDQSVRGEVSLSLKAVPVVDAVELVARATGLAYRYVGNTLVVGMPDRFKSGFDHIESKVFKLDYASPEDMKDALKVIISPDKIQMDSRTNSVVLTGVSVELDEAEKIIRKLDVPVPMVRIDARLEEIAQDALDQYGISFQEVGEYGQFTYTLVLSEPRLSFQLFKYMILQLYKLLR